MRLATPRLLVAVALAAVLAGCGTPPADAPSPAGPGATEAGSAALAQLRDAPAGPVRPAQQLAPSRPVGLDVPGIGVRTHGLADLGIDDRGALEVPPDAATAGWFTLGPTPGATGPAVIAAHVDYAGVPGLFSRLRDLAPGAEVGVHRADGTEAVFTAYRVERYAKERFPTEDVYGDTAGSELRLITCGGVFDRGTRQYSDNVVVYARLVGSR